MFFALVFVTSFAGPMYGVLFGVPDILEHLTQMAFMSLTGGMMIWGFEILFIPSRYGEPFRRLPFFSAVMARVVFVAVAVTINGPLGILILDGVFNPLASFELGVKLYIYVAAVVFLLFSITQIVRIVGPRVLGNILIGRYRRPKSEERIFLFLDIKDSTPLSEKLGDIGVQELIARFFFDITEPILEWGGEVHRYIGDEVVVTWFMDQGLENSRCLRCCFAIQDRIRQRSPRYLELFGTVPEFRIGLHGGPVVAAQCGDVKQEIVFFGDTINTTARIEQYCKVADRDLLVSGDLWERLPKSENWQSEVTGSVVLRGRREEMKLVHVNRGDPQ